MGAQPLPKSASSVVAQDNVSLVIGGTSWSGWSSVKVTTGVEQCPNAFELALTEKSPGSEVPLVAKPFDTCEVKLGSDVVLTGYVDRLAMSISSSGHEVRLVGRGRCADLVDCSVEWPSGELANVTALGIAQKLAQAYGIRVECRVDPGPTIPQFNVAITDSAWSIIEEVCRYAGLLAYEGPDGTLILDQAGTVRTASGFVEGANVEEAQVVFAGDARYSEIGVFFNSMDQLEGIGDPGNLISRARDPNVPRNRKHAIVAEAASGGPDLAYTRAKWEASRRFGRSASVRLVIDSWRDASGKLWTPNTLASVELPALRLAHVDWCVAAVAYLKDQRGTRCEVSLMDRAAFLPEPIVLSPLLEGVE